ncbi:MAG: hypothetical protein PSX80_12835 [bacterium]|nr:hypothetical protein [bacterium]
MKVYLNVALLFLVCAAAAGAQSPAKILKQAEKALGGAKAIQSINSVERVGTVIRMNDGATGKYSSRSLKPNLYSEAYDLGGFEYAAGYNGRSGWRRDSRNGLSTLTGVASNDFQAESLFRNSLWLDHRKQKAKIVRAGTAEIDGRQTNALKVTTSKGVDLKLYFDSSTGLLIREEIPSGDSTKIIDYADYRKVGNVLLPFIAKIATGEEKLEISLSDIRVNPQIARAEFDFLPASGEPLPDIRSLLTQLQQNEDEVEKLLDSYSYVQKSTKRELGKDGILRETESETRQLSFYKGYRIARVTEKNGKPLSEKNQRDEDKSAEKRVEEIEKIIAKREKAELKNGPPREDGPRVSIAELLRASNLVNPRRERFRGRDVIVFDFEPNPSFDYKNAKSMLKFFGKTAGVMWIDEEDKQVARLEAYLADSFNIGGGVLAKLRKGASFVLEQQRINDEIWLPSIADINLSVRVLLVKGIDVNQRIESYDYRKFTTEVRDAKVGASPSTQP